MTPATPAAGAGPIHRATLGLQQRLQLVFPEKARFQHELLPAPLTVSGLVGLSAARAPLVALAFLGFKPKPNSGRRLTGKLRFGIYLVASNPKSGPRLLGDKAGIGLAQMVHAAILGIHGATIGGEGDPGAGTVDFGDIETTDGLEWGGKDFACAAITAELDAAFTTVDGDELLKLVATLDLGGPGDPATAMTFTIERPAP